MIPVLLDVRDRKVLVVGAGHVGSRKIAKMFQEGADLTVISLSEPEYGSWIHDAYRTEYLDQGYFLVMACTDNPDVNNRIVEDCRKRNIPCMSVNQSDASVHGMREVTVGNIQLGLSSGYHFPYTKPLTDELTKVVSLYEKKIGLLGAIRPFVLPEVENATSLFDTLYETGEDFLKFYLSVVQNKEGIVYVHHVNTEIPVTFDNGYCMDYEQFDKVKDVFFDSLNITVVPLVADYGKIYEKIKSLCKDNMTLRQPLLADDKAVEVLLKDCVNPVVIVHPRTDKQLMNRLKRYADVYLLKEPIVADGLVHDVIIGLVTHGTHYQDVKNTIDKAIREGAELNEKGTILQQKPFTEYLMKSVKKS